MSDDLLRRQALALSVLCKILSHDEIFVELGDEYSENVLVIDGRLYLREEAEVQLVRGLLERK
jgi:hypothetical protein